MPPSAVTNTRTSTRLDGLCGEDPGVAPFGINLVGQASFEFSLSISLRHIARALLQRGVPICIYDLPTGDMPHGPDLSLQPHFAGSLQALPYAINLFCVNVLALPALLLRLKAQELDWNRRLNVAVVFWELPVIPRHLVPVLQAFDVLLCGSWFVREAVAAHVPSALALTLAYPLALPDFERVPRSTFGIPGDAFVFYFSFDPVSGPDRKNPGAVVDAFRQAFPSDPGVHLVVKLNVSADAPQPWPPGVERFLAQCEGDPRITVLTRTGSYAQALAICEACCDCFVSLHRSEGLGMGPMEAMLLGKPVIITAWSGSMSYATASNACLVPHAFVRPDGWDAPHSSANRCGGPSRPSPRPRTGCGVWRSTPRSDRTSPAAASRPCATWLPRPRNVHSSTTWRRCMGSKRVARIPRRRWTLRRAAFGARGARTSAFMRCESNAKLRQLCPAPGGCCAGWRAAGRCASSHALAAARARSLNKLAQ